MKYSKSDSLEEERKSKTQVPVIDTEAQNLRLMEAMVIPLDYEVLLFHGSKM